MGSDGDCRDCDLVLNKAHRISWNHLFRVEHVEDVEHFSCCQGFPNKAINSIEMAQEAGAVHMW